MSILKNDGFVPSSFEGPSMPTHVSRISINLRVAKTSVEITGFCRLFLSFFLEMYAESAESARTLATKPQSQKK